MDELNKEEIYDKEISPLMTKIIKICTDNKIAMISSFSIPNKEDNGLMCTTALLQKEFNPPTFYDVARRDFMKTPFFTSMIISKGNKE